ncbi:MAG: A/G-specific adenine glycosylase [Acidobacteriota bacterium]
MSMHHDLLQGSVTPGQRADLDRLLLSWYSAHKRDLPWRKTRDPYRIWISEVMLQQTQVETVIPYYRRFLKLFPSLGRLAQATMEEVLLVWAGLGYYSRARNLHKAAQQIVFRHEGLFPQTFEDVLSLPGIGRYTAGAIMSIAFGQPYPVVDGNVTRVLTRLFRVEQDIRQRRTHDLLWKIASHLVPRERPGDFNQALMELGATVCTPRQPSCRCCPFGGLCKARESGVQDHLPNKENLLRSVKQHLAVAVIHHQGRVLMRQRKEGSLLKGLWEFPNTGFQARPVSRRSLTQTIQRSIGRPIRIGSPLPGINHAITHRRIAIRPYWVELRATGTPGSIPGMKWVPMSQLTRYPMDAATQRIADVIRRRRGTFASRPQQDKHGEI